MKILVTGAGGFIGRHLLGRLNKKFGESSVIVLSSKRFQENRCIPSENYGFDSSYLMDNGCEDVEAVIHAGSFTPKKHSDADDIEKASENIRSTQRLLSAKLPGLRKFIFCSSADVYGNAGGTVCEESDTVPLTMYGWSKLYCEKMAASCYRDTGVACQILRIGHVYGEGEEAYRKAIPVMVRNALQNREIQIYGDGSAVRTFIYAGDVAEAVIRSMELQDSNVINVAGDEKITVRGLADIITRYTGSASVISCADGSVPARDCIYDNTKLKALLLPELTPFAEGLGREINYMRERMGWSSEYTV